MKAALWLCLMGGLVVFSAPPSHSDQISAPAAPVPLAQSDEDDEMREGIDVQSPEEIERARREIEALFGGPQDRANDESRVQSYSFSQKRSLLAPYAHLDPKNEVPDDLLEKTLLYFDKNKDKFPNQNFISIVDFRPRSDKFRLFIINMATGAVEKYHTTHGLNSDKDKDGFAERFGNVINSGKSSLGFVRTAEEYYGKFGRAVRLDGLSDSNSNLRARAVVLHGWKKAYEKDVIQGLSWGCVTLDYSVHDGVLDKLKEGSLLYAGVSKGKR